MKEASFKHSFYYPRASFALGWYVDSRYVVFCDLLHQMLYTLNSVTISGHLKYER